jgi:probable phosphomutase (TIGR03848 family)
LLRHGRTSANADGVLAGWSDVGLDETGRRQAKAVGERLGGVPLKGLYSSPLPRCLQTIAAVAEARPDLPVTTDDRLGECRYGDWEGRKISELAKEELWRVVQAYPSAAVFPGEAAEPLAVTAARAVAAVRETDAAIAAAHGPDAIWLACSHGDVIKAIVADALGMHLDLFQRIVVEPCSVTVIRYTPLRPFLVRLNDIGDLSHLTTEAPRTSEAPVGGGSGGAAV